MQSIFSSVFINHIHIYPIIAVTFFTLFLNDYLGEMSFLYSVSHFIIESVNCFEKKRVLVEKCIMAISTEFNRKSFKKFHRTRRIFSNNRFPSTVWKVSKYRVFSGLYFLVFGPEKNTYLDTSRSVAFADFLTGFNWPTHWEKGGLCLPCIPQIKYLLYFIFNFFCKFCF